jgi:hypothetical protein
MGKSVPLVGEGEDMCAILSHTAPHNLKEMKAILLFFPKKLMAVVQGKYYTPEQFNAWETGE